MSPKSLITKPKPQSEDMKVHLYGNTLNNSYNLTCFLRAKGIDAEMFLDDSSSLQQDYPWWEDKDLSKDSLPSWIHYYTVNPNFLFPQKKLKALITHFSQCDVAIVCGWGPIIAKRAGVPYLFHSYGADLNITAFADEIMGAFRSMTHLKKPRGLRSLFLFGHFQKKAIQNANRIGIYMGYQVNTYVKKLGILHKMKKLRLAWDIEKYKIPEDLKLREKYKQFDVVYFMQTRHTWKSVWYDLKGNDKFIWAFGRFIKELNPNVVLVMIEKGNDLVESKRIVSELGIEKNVEWVKEMNKDGIRAYNSLSNVIAVDQFWHDKWFIRYPADRAKPRMGFGSGCIEALSAHRPLITAFFDEDFYDGNKPPILSAFTQQEIYERLVESITMGQEERVALGQRGYEFVKKYHSWENSVTLFIETLSEILEETRLTINRNAKGAS